MSTKTKFFHSGMSNAPALNNTAGALLSVIDACLRTGFGSVSVTSLVVAGGIATATVASHSAIPLSVVQVEGVTSTLAASQNGHHRVTSTESTKVRWATSAADGTATGTITLKVAPLGWTRLFSGTNKAVYQPSAPEASGFALRMDDTGTTTSRVVGYEAMTDIDTGVRAFPTSTQMSGGLHWAKSASSTARPWVFFGDDQAFYFGADPSGLGVFQLTMFGDPLPMRPGDPWSALITGARDESYLATQTTPPPGECAASVRDTTLAATSAGRFLARESSGIGGAVRASFLGVGHQSSNGSPYSGSESYAFGIHPNRADNALLTAPVLVYETNGYRATLPGLLHMVQAGGRAFSLGDTVQQSDGSVLVAVPVGRTDNNDSMRGAVFFSLADWRA